MTRRVAVLGLLLLSIPLSLLAAETNTSTKKDPQSEKRGGAVTLQQLFGDQAESGTCCITCSSGSHWTLPVESVDECLATCEIICGGPCVEGGGCF